MVGSTRVVVALAEMRSAPAARIAALLRAQVWTQRWVQSGQRVPDVEAFAFNARETRGGRNSR